jgi:hypothetical protein
MCVPGLPAIVEVDMPTIFRRRDRYRQEKAFVEAAPLRPKYGPFAFYLRGLA